ncbi:hypothetical protein [Halobaculum sp. EA56]|uniref:hypothetical protein n=1 Tax=Halobaculum sp. EA56 TaxID=3421648 RepID=UPI003EBFE7BF
MNPRRCSSRTAILAVAVLMLGAASGTATLNATDPDYGVSIDGASDVPPVEFESEGTTVEVTQIGHATNQDVLRFDVDAPDGEYYTVRVVNSEQTVVETDAGRGSDSFELSLRYYDVGTYVIAITDESGDQREVLAAEPFVVSGYVVNHSAPSRVDPDGTLRVNVTVDPRGDPPAFTDITVAVGDDDTQVVHNATRVNETTFTATFDMDEFARGEYTVVAGVRGELGFNGTVREFLGVSTSTTVSVAEAKETATPTATSTNSTTSAARTTTATTDVNTTSTATTTNRTAATTSTVTDTTSTEAVTTRNQTTDASTTRPQTTDSTTVSQNTTADGATSPGNATTGAVNGSVESADSSTSLNATESGIVEETTAATAPLFSPLGYVLLLVVGLLLLAVHKP